MGRLIKRENSYHLVQRVVVLSEDFKLAYKVRIAIETSPFEFEHLTSIEEVFDTDIVIQSPTDLPIDHPKRIVISNKTDNSGIMAHIYRAEKGGRGGELIVGIDPGKTIGVGVLFNGKVVGSSAFHSVVMCERWIRKTVKHIKYSTFHIKIGDGGGSFQEEIIDYITKQFSKYATIMIVNERGSSKGHKSMYRTKHEYAALVIAGRKGKKFV